MKRITWQNTTERNLPGEFGDYTEYWLAEVSGITLTVYRRDYSIQYHNGEYAKLYRWSVSDSPWSGDADSLESAKRKCRQALARVTESNKK